MIQIQVLLILLDSLWEMFFGAYEQTLGFEIFWSLFWTVIAFGVYLKTENFIAFAMTLLIPGVLLSAMFGKFQVLVLLGVSLIAAYTMFKVFYKGRGWM